MPNLQLLKCHTFFCKIEDPIKRFASHEKFAVTVFKHKTILSGFLSAVLESDPVFLAISPF